MVGFSPKIMTSDLKKVNDVGGAASYVANIMRKHQLDFVFQIERQDSHLPQGIWFIESLKSMRHFF